VPDWSIELEGDGLDAVPPGPPLGLRLAGAEVVPPLSALPGREFCSHAPKTRAAATAVIPIRSLRIIANVSV